MSPKRTQLISFLVKNVHKHLQAYTIALLILGPVLGVGFELGKSGWWADILLCFGVIASLIGSLTLLLNYHSDTILRNNQRIPIEGWINRHRVIGAYSPPIILLNLSLFSMFTLNLKGLGAILAFNCVVWFLLAATAMAVTIVERDGRKRERQRQKEAARKEWEEKNRIEMLLDTTPLQNFIEKFSMEDLGFALRIVTKQMPPQPNFFSWIRPQSFGCNDQEAVSYFEFIQKMVNVQLLLNQGTLGIGTGFQPTRRAEEMLRAEIKRRIDPDFKPSHRRRLSILTTHAPAQEFINELK